MDIYLQIALCNGIIRSRMVIPLEQSSKTTRAYKDTVFSSLFYTCDNAIEHAKSLYQALTGRKVTHIEKCRLEDVIFREFKNDVAYIIDGRLVCFIEHQSTINPNMPFRLFIYAARTYERTFMSGDAVYSSKLVQIPTPEFYVLYNGTSPLRTDILKLSDAFKTPLDTPQLELVVRVIDINYSRLKDTELAQCQTLTEYAFLVNKVREYNGDITQAVKDCVSQDVLADYLTYYGSEVVNMLFEEYDAETARKVLIEETREDAMEEGRVEGEASMIKRLFNLGNTVKQIASLFKMPESEVEKYLAMN